MNLKMLPLSLKEFMAKYHAPKEQYIRYLWQNRKIHHYDGSFKAFYQTQMGNNMALVKETVIADLEYAIENLERLVEHGKASEEGIAKYVEYLRTLIKDV